MALFPAISSPPTTTGDSIRRTFPFFWTGRTSRVLPVQEEHDGKPDMHKLLSSGGDAERRGIPGVLEPRGLESAPAHKIVCCLGLGLRRIELKLMSACHHFDVGSCFARAFALLVLSAFASAAALFFAAAEAAGRDSEIKFRYAFDIGGEPGREVRQGNALNAVCRLLHPRDPGVGGQVRPLDRFFIRWLAEIP